jgi:hypothetical protein
MTNSISEAYTHVDAVSKQGVGWLYWGKIMLKNYSMTEMVEPGISIQKLIRPLMLTGNNLSYAYANMSDKQHNNQRI